MTIMVPVRFILFLTFLCLLLWPNTPSQAASPGYEVKINQVSGSIQTLLMAISDCVALKDHPPSTPGLLQKRMDNDVQTFIQALKSQGYFQAKIHSQLKTQNTPWLVSFDIQLGPQFTFAQPEVSFDPADDTLNPLVAPHLGPIQAGQKYNSKLVQDVEKDLLQVLQTQGYPSPELGPRRIIANHATQKVRVHLKIKTNGRASFGPTIITGLKKVSEDLVRQKLTWVQGQDFDLRKIDHSRSQLIETGLFRSVYLQTEHEHNASQVIMHVQLLEGPHRTIGSGLWYYSDQGLGIGLGWTHRNLWGAGQEYQVDLQLAEKNQELSSALILPDFGHVDQSLNLMTKYEYEDTDGYESTNLYWSAILRRNFGPLNLGAGLAYRLSNIKKESSRNFNLISTPMLAEWSTADHPLDPTQGLTLAARIEPFMDISTEQTSFVSWNLSARHYWPLRADKSLIFATRGRYSLLAGAHRHSVPEDLLLYAGGGGSVRGYAYQYAGDLDDDDNPLGGVSALDFSAELRWRMKKNLGAVIFCDGGTAMRNHNLDNWDDLFWGVGTGLRYYTPIGPLRFDVAMPMDRRGTIDAPFQVYISLGQAF